MIAKDEGKGFPGGAGVKNPPANAGDTRDMGLISGLERSVKEGNGKPLQYSGLENSVDRGVWQATVYRDAESQTQLSMRTHTHGQRKGVLWNN